MREMIRAVLKNLRHSEYGTCTIPFPIPAQGYDETVETLQALAIGDAVEKDCHVLKIGGGYPVLKHLEGRQINVEEFDWLARRLDSFSEYEALQFQAMAEKLQLFDMRSLIDLTFCCQQVTVVADFSHLEEIGRRRYLAVQGVEMSARLPAQASGVETGPADDEAVMRRLLASGKGTVTPYGVVYDEGLELLSVYDGVHLPCYIYGEEAVAVGLRKKGIQKGAAEAAQEKTFVYLPASDTRLSRMLERAGLTDSSEADLSLEYSTLSPAVTELLSTGGCPLEQLNQTCRELEALTEHGQQTLEAAILLARPQNTRQLAALVHPQTLDAFTLLPGVTSMDECGRYLVRHSGCYRYDETLAPSCGYEAIGRRWLQGHPGRSTKAEYVSYDGAEPLEAIFARAEQVTGYSKQSHEDQDNEMCGGMGLCQTM